MKREHYDMIAKLQCVLSETHGDASCYCHEADEDCPEDCEWCAERACCEACEAIRDAEAMLSTEGRGGFALCDLSGVDWEMLREQKRVLAEMLPAPGRSYESDVRGDALSGVLNLLDSIQDDAAKELGEEAVFGKSDE
jgi:hypothetical protein